MPPRQLRVGFVGAAGFDPDEPHLSVDGMTPRGPNLSHWPGNRTPRLYKADLSTGICLHFARAQRGEQETFLGDAVRVVNDHYDTDGYLSMLAVTRPDLALAHEDLCLAAAATGDFQAYQTRLGFAVDRIVVNLAARESPVAGEFSALSGPDRSLARYRWLLDHAEEVLGHPDSFADCWLGAWHRITEELRACRSGALTRTVHPEVGFSVVESRSPVSRMALNSLAGAFRVLHVEHHGAGAKFRYHDRTESWFEVVTFTAMPRIDLRPIASHLRQLEPPGGEPYRWCADSPDEPVPELWFGVDAAQEYGAVTRELGVSGLTQRTVVDTILAHFAGVRG